MFRRLISCAALLLFVAGTASAVEPTDYGHKGGYMGVNGGYAVDNGSDRIGRLTFSSGTASAWVGYRMDQLIAIEIQGEYNHGLKDVSGWNLTGNLNWYPVQWWYPGFWFQPFFVTGGGFMIAKPVPNRSTNLNGAFRLGGGMDFYFHKHWNVRFKAEWVKGVGKLSDLAYAPITLGIQYNF